MIENNFLNKFNETIKKYLDDNSICATSPIPYSLFIKKSKDEVLPTRAIITGIHGNEIHGIQAMIDLLEKKYNIIKNISNPTVFILGNPFAIEKNQRYVKSDLNRSFNNKRYITEEESRAKSIEKLIQKCKYLIDIHSTIEPTKRPYAIFAGNKKLVNFAENLGGEIKDLIAVSSLNSNKSCMCIDEYLLYIKPDSISITFEVGSISDKSKEPFNLAKTLLINFLINTKSIVKPTNLKIKKNKYRIWEQCQTIENNDDTSIVKGLINLETIKKGELIAIENDRPIYAKRTGVILFPKYGFTKDKYILRMAKLKNRKKSENHAK